MQRMNRLGLATVFFVLAAAPLASQAAGLPGVTGSPYRGTVTVQAFAPPNERPVHRDSGQAEVTLEMDDQARVIVEGHATIGGQRALRFAYTLSEQADGSWVDRTQDASMTISPTGDIAILGKSDGSTLAATGTLDESALRMRLRATGNPPQPELSFVFDLASQKKDQRRSQRPDCRQIVWQPRTIANPFGSSMSSVMVPVCVSGP